MDTYSIGSTNPDFLRVESFQKPDRELALPASVAKSRREFFFSFLSFGGVESSPQKIAQIDRDRRRTRRQFYEIPPGDIRSLSRNLIRDSLNGSRSQLNDRSKVVRAPSMRKSLGEDLLVLKHSRGFFGIYTNELHFE